MLVANARTSGDGIVSIGRTVAPENASDRSRLAAATDTIRPANAPPVASRTLSTSASITIR